MIEDATIQALAKIAPITDTDDPRYYHYVGDGITGYGPTEIGAYVHIRAARGYVLRGLLLDAANGNYRTPTLYQVIEIEPGYDVEVVGGTAHVGTQYICRDLGMSFEWTLKVPAIRLVKADPPAPHVEPAK